MQKWDFKTRTYSPYTVPADWNVVLYSDDMAEMVNCAGCGKYMEYGFSYTSRTIHNAIGLGYPVCETCYGKEWANAQEANR